MTSQVARPSTRVGAPACVHCGNPVPYGEGLGCVACRPKCPRCGEPAGRCLNWCVVYDAEDVAALLRWLDAETNPDGDEECPDCYAEIYWQLTPTLDIIATIEHAEDCERSYR